MGKEAELERKVKTYAESKGVWTRKFVSPSHNSVPDRVFAAYGRILWLEFKAPGKLPTMAQLDEINELRARRCLATWVDDYDNARMLIDYMVDKHKTDASLKILHYCEMWNHRAKVKLKVGEEPELDDLI